MHPYRYSLNATSSRGLAPVSSRSMAPCSPFFGWLEFSGPQIWRASLTGSLATREDPTPWLLDTASETAASLLQTPLPTKEDLTDLTWPLTTWRDRPACIVGCRSYCLLMGSMAPFCMVGNKANPWGHGWATSCDTTEPLFQLKSLE